MERKDSATSKKISKNLPKVGKLPEGTAELRFMGDMVIPKILNAEHKKVFSLYQKLFEQLASLPKVDRLLNYRILTGLILTSHARREKKAETRKKIFELKNGIIRSILSDADQMKKVKLSRLKSNRKKVLNFCETCQKRIDTKEVNFFKAEPCESCVIDDRYFDVISLYFKSAIGQGSLFMSIDRMEEFGVEEPERVADLNRSLESFVYDGKKIHYRALFGFNLDSALKLAEHLS